MTVHPYTRLFSKVADPTVTDDTTLGYETGDIWVTATKVYICINPASGVAVWVQTPFALGDLTDVDPLNGIASDYLGGDGVFHPIPTTLSLFLSETASDIGGYDTLTIAHPTGGEKTAAASISAADTVIEEWILIANQFDFISGQVLHAHLHLAKTAGIKDVTCYVKVYSRASGGSETLLGTSAITGQLTGSNTPYDFDIAIADTSFLSTDRFLIKVFGSPTGVGTTPTATIYYEGTTDSRVEIGTNLTPTGGGHTTEEIQDIVGDMVSGNTETGISVTYDDAGGKLNFNAQTAGDARYVLKTLGYTPLSLTTADYIFTPLYTGGVNVIMLNLSGLTGNRTLQLAGGGSWGTTLIIIVTAGHATYSCTVGPAAGITLHSLAANWGNPLQASKDALMLVTNDGTNWEVSSQDIPTIFASAAKGVTNGDSHDHSGGDGAQIDYNGLANLPTTDGWVPKSDTWTRTGNYTFTVTGDVTAIYRKGAKVRYKDGGGYEYGVIASASYGAPNTTVTLISNSDYAMAAATITDKYISYIEVPEGFPQVFNFTPSWTNVTVGNAIQVAKWSVQGSILKGNVSFKFPASSPTCAITGDIGLTPPVAIDSGLSTFTTLGSAGCVDLNTALYSGSCVWVISAGYISLRIINASGTYSFWTTCSSTIPFTWNVDDLFTMEFSYLF